MAVGLSALPDLVPVPGIRLGTVCAGIKKPGRRDLVVIEPCEGATTAAVFTRNAFCAAPVSVAKDHLAKTPPRYPPRSEVSRSEVPVETSRRLLRPAS